ncbi:MAG: hypothetical protein FWE36_06280 [Erysipelotrichales bacterium]|nr:hypothetical protein [Erysipelotrichales bacterium]
MIIEYLDEDGRKYIYDEAFLTGKKDIYLDDVKLEKIAKNKYKLPDSEEEVVVKGNFIFGVILQFNEDKQIPLLQNKSYEWVLLFLPIINIIIGVLGGPIGGALSGATMLISIVVNAFILRSNKSTALRVFGCIAMTLLILAVWFFGYLYLTDTLF